MFNIASTIGGSHDWQWMQLYSYHSCDKLNCTTTTARLTSHLSQKKSRCTRYSLYQHVADKHRQSTVTDVVENMTSVLFQISCWIQMWKSFNKKLH